MSLLRTDGSVQPAQRWHTKNLELLRTVCDGTVAQKVNLLSPALSRKAGQLWISIVPDGCTHLCSHLQDAGRLETVLTSFHNPGREVPKTCKVPAGATPYADVDSAPSQSHVVPSMEGRSRRVEDSIPLHRRREHVSSRHDRDSTAPMPCTIVILAGIQQETCIDSGAHQTAVRTWNRKGDRERDSQQCRPIWARLGELCELS
jgi:hypothetical protein